MTEPSRRPEPGTPCSGVSSSSDGADWLIIESSTPIKKVGAKMGEIAGKRVCKRVEGVRCTDVAESDASHGPLKAERRVRFPYALPNSILTNRIKALASFETSKNRPVLKSGAKMSTLRPGSVCPRPRAGQTDRGGGGSARARVSPGARDPLERGFAGKGRPC